MSVKIRLTRAGAKKRPYYHVVVADSRAPRDGRFIEKVGRYNPLLDKTDAQRVVFKSQRVQYWLGKGAKPSDRVWGFLDQAGITTEKKPVRNNPKKALPGKKAIERQEAKQKKTEDQVKKQDDDTKNSG